MASISSFTRNFEDRLKISQVFAYADVFYFLHVFFRINLDTPPKHPFCSDGFSLGVRLYRRLWSLRAQNIRVATAWPVERSDTAAEARPA
jgi:hypothetical protein